MSKDQKKHTNNFHDENDLEWIKALSYTNNKNNSSNIYNQSTIPSYEDKSGSQSGVLASRDLNHTRQNNSINTKGVSILSQKQTKISEKKKKERQKRVLSSYNFINDENQKENQTMNNQKENIDYKTTRLIQELQYPSQDYDHQQLQKFQQDQENQRISILDNGEQNQQRDHLEKRKLRRSKQLQMKQNRFERTNETVELFKFLDQISQQQNQDTHNYLLSSSSEDEEILFDEDVGKKQLSEKLRRSQMNSSTTKEKLLSWPKNLIDNSEFGDSKLIRKATQKSSDLRKEKNKRQYNKLERPTKQKTSGNEINRLTNQNQYKQNLSPSIIDMLIKQNEDKTNQIDCEELNLKVESPKTADEENNLASSSFSSATDGNSSFNNSIIQHRNRVQQMALIQREQYLLWFNSGNMVLYTQAYHYSNQNLYSQSLFKQDFTQETPFQKYGMWEQAQFSCGRYNESPAPMIVKDTWIDESLATSKKGLHLKQQILTPKCHFDLRYFSLRFTTTVRLYGNSTFWIFSRLKGKELSPLTPIIILRKIADTQRLFCIMGALSYPSLKDPQQYPKASDFSQMEDSNFFSHQYNENMENLQTNVQDLNKQKQEQQNLTFRYFKSQEIPLFYYDSRAKIYSDTPSMKQVKADYVDLEFTVHDNGDDRVCVEIQMGPRKRLNIVCNMFLPVIDNSGLNLFNNQQEQTKVMVAAAGNTVIVKEIKAKLVQRQEQFKTGIIENGRCPQDCCCSIF